MVKKDKKSKDAEKKARKAKSQEKKSVKSEKKAKVKGRVDEDSDVEDVDLDAVLAEYARQQEQFLKVTETVSEPPTPRGSSAIIGSPGNHNELFLFGGEYFNGALATFYNDLFIYNINRDEWRKVTSRNSPLPRSGHAWCRGGNAGGIYLFGGEFSSPKQGTFYHYNDFCRLDPISREWTRLLGKKGPPARSGHRLTYFKNYIILFGGFQDTSQTTKYLNDLWIYDCTNFTWHEPKLPPGTGKPDARSSFSLLPHEKGAVLLGGYSRVKVTVNAGTKGAKGGTRVTTKPVVHQDTWFLRIAPPATDAPSGTLPVVKWERRKRPANAPNPIRAGATMCSHRGRGIQFGGVHDVEESEEGIDSEFFNQLFAWNVDRNRYFPLTLRRPRATAKKAGLERGRRDRTKQDEEELMANLRALEMKTGTVQDNVEISKTSEEEEEDERPEKPVIFEMPHPRFNAQLAVQNDTLFIYGGTFEKGDREYTFDEMWAIDLGKLDGVREIFKRELEDWQGSEDEESDEEEGEDEDDEEGSIGDTTTEVGTVVSENPTVVSRQPSKQEEEEEEEETEEITSASDGLPYPRPFEALRDFYARTSVQWQEIIIADLSGQNAADAQTVKEVRKLAFDQAEDKWWDCREEIRTLEDEQTEAGIGDVVSIADKAQAGAGPGRRR
jgi:hypothetical protein